MLWRPAQELCTFLSELDEETFYDKFKLFMITKKYFEENKSFIPQPLNYQTNQSILNTTSMEPSANSSQLNKSKNETNNKSLTKKKDNKLIVSQMKLLKVNAIGRPIKKRY